MDSGWYKRGMPARGGEPAASDWPGHSIPCYFRVTISSFAMRSPIQAGLPSLKRFRRGRHDRGRSLSS